MKSILLRSCVAAGTLFAAASAHAQVDINISGAVAFRDVAYRVIRNVYGANLVSQNPADSASAPTQLKVTWSGKIPSLFGDQTVTVRAFYNGGVAGVQDLTQNRNVQFLATATPGDTNLVTLQSDLGFSPVFQRSTPYATPPLEDAKFGATPVFFVKSSSAPADLADITSQQFRVLAANGAVPGWFLTGNTNDTGLVYYVSRAATAGQRVLVQKENSFNGSVISYLWDTNSSQYVIDTLGRSATEITDILNHGGPAISFLVGVDAINVNGGANILTFNGASAFTGSYSPVKNDHTPVINGQYSQWGYEHLLSRTTASANVKAFRDALLAGIDVDLKTSPFSLPLSSLKVERTGEGSPVSPRE